MNYLESFLEADINISTSGDNTLISAPGAGHYLAIDFISFVPSATVTVQLKNGTTNYGGPLPMVASQPLTWENATRNEHGILTMSDNAAFVMNLSTAAQVGGIIRYRIVGN